MSKVYAILAHQGEYSDQEHWVVKVFVDKDKAVQLVDSTKKLIKEYQDWLNDEWEELRKKYGHLNVDYPGPSDEKNKKRQQVYLESKKRQDAKQQQLIVDANLDSMRKPSNEKWGDYLPDTLSWEEVELVS